jgi:hypothetical protein
VIETLLLWLFRLFPLGWFGSFLTSNDPHDLDIAVFQDSDESYYPLAMKYRRKLRIGVATRTPQFLPPERPTGG